MPLDTKRLPVPEESKAHILFRQRECQSAALLNEKEQRQDGRKWQQVRPLYTKTGIVKKAKGSAYIELDRTKVICSVYGPRETERRDEFSIKGQIHCEFKFATFSSSQQRYSHMREPEEQHYSSILEQALKPAVILNKFPKAKLDIFIHVLENDGGALSASVTCASLALSDAAIEMYDMVVACSLKHQQELILLDPTLTELEHEGCKSSEVLLAYMPHLQQITTVHQTTKLTADQTIQDIQLCVDACLQISELLAKKIKKDLSNKAI